MPFSDTLTLRVRKRVREEMRDRKLTTRDVAGILKWSQSQVSHLLNGRVRIGLEDLEGFSFAVSLPAVELIRDRGMEFCAEMTPTEFKLHQYFHALTPVKRAALLETLNLTEAEPRHAAPKRELKRVVNRR